MFISTTSTFLFIGSISLEISFHGAKFQVNIYHLAWVDDTTESGKFFILKKYVCESYNVLSRRYVQWMSFQIL